MVKLELNAFGDITSSTVLATRGQTLPGLGLVAFLSSRQNSHAMNNHGSVISVVGLQRTPQVGRLAVLLDMDEVLAEEDTPSSVGTVWDRLFSAQVAINDRGDHVLSGALQSSADIFLIEKNGLKFVQHGDVLPSFSTQPIEVRTRAPLLLANTGDVFWRATTAGGEAAFMRNHDPIVELGSIVAGGTVTGLADFESCFAVSPDGRYFVCRATLDGSREVALLFDFGLVLELPGCAGNAGTLRLVSGQARVGQPIELAMDEGHVAGAIARIIFSTQQRFPGWECGSLTPGGELLISQQHRIASVYAPPWDGTNPTSAVVAIPNDLALLDLELFAQGAFRTPGTRTLSLTNALRIQIGAP
jgi:hypothetical protein